MVVHFQSCLLGLLHSLISYSSIPSLFYMNAAKSCQLAIMNDVTGEPRNLCLLGQMLC
uniref:Protein binding protein n=1 Tax=Rhizophora mucronata TaxID=61149 RepID=A0A2P2M382_RHIMU